MKRFESLAVPALVLAVLCSAPAHAADAPKDALCPRAVPKISAFNDAAAAGDGAKIAAAAQAAADAYQLCAVDAQVATSIEPAVNYDKTRRAQFLVVVGRADAAVGKPAEALAALHTARTVADEVYTWLPSSTSYTTSNRTSGTSSDRNGDRVGSRYRDSAHQIQAAADAELAKLEPAGAAPAPSASPQAH